MLTYEWGMNNRVSGNTPIIYFGIKFTSLTQNTRECATVCIVINSLYSILGIA